MLRREFLGSFAASLLAPALPLSRGEKLAQAARLQIGVTVSYDPSYVRLMYPNGDVPRSTGICADVVVRACRDAIGLDLQQLVHEDMVRDFTAYPSRQIWGNKKADSNIDHRRVLNLEVFWRRAGGRVWAPAGKNAGDAFPKPMQAGDFVTWMLNGHLPHVGVINTVKLGLETVVHNVGRGVEETPLSAFAPHPAHGLFRWPS